MGDRTGIQWTDATWNPVTGCTRVSEGCRNCYIERTPPFRMAGRKFINGSTGVQLHPDRLGQPLRWKQPRRIFVNSLSDLFHEAVPDEFIARVFSVMALAAGHTFQILTKRPERMQQWATDEAARALVIAASGKADWKAVRWPYAWPLPNVWLGVSVEDQKTADERIPLLLKTPAAVRFVSYEPALGPLNLRLYMPVIERGRGGPIRSSGGLDWLICGFESGPKARPGHPDWARSVRDQCVGAGVPYLFKQWGEWAPYSQMKSGETPGCTDYHSRRNAKSVVLHPDGRQENIFTMGAMTMLKIGKKLSGRLLDGREWNEFPKGA
jgi:protein gp37